MKTKKLILPIIILVLGIVAMGIAHTLCNIVKIPAVTEKEFPFSVTYESNGETKEYAGTYKCMFSEDFGNSTYTTDRYYKGLHVETGEEGSVKFTVEEKEGKELIILMEFYPDYLLGDPNYDDYYDDYPYEPRMLVYDKEGYEYEDEETLSQFDAKIIGWEFPQPIENTLEFSHISRISVNSIFPMLAVAYLTLIICMIFVKKDAQLEVTPMDKLSVIFNFIIGLAVAPIMALIASLTQIYASGEEFIYQVFYVIPAITVLCVALSLCTRRKGYSKFGFFAQFTGPVLFVISMIIEPI